MEPKSKIERLEIISARINAITVAMRLPASGPIEDWAAELQRLRAEAEAISFEGLNAEELFAYAITRAAFPKEE